MGHSHSSEKPSVSTGDDRTVDTGDKDEPSPGSDEAQVEEPAQLLDPAEDSLWDGSLDEEEADQESRDQGTDDGKCEDGIELGTPHEGGGEAMHLPSPPPSFCTLNYENW